MQAVGAHSFHSLIRKLHAPLPLSARESQQLLNTITTSFQQQLDRHHPPHQLIAQNSPPTPSTPSSSLHGRFSSTNRPLSSQHLADQHLASVLSSPLFSKGPGASSHGKQLVSRVEYSLACLERRIASGTATLDHVHECLRRIWTSRDRGSMKRLGAATRILSCIQTSGQISVFEFLAGILVQGETRLMVRSLIGMLVVERRQDVIWTWLRSDSEQFRVLRPDLFSAFLRAERLMDGVDSSMRVVLRMPFEINDYVSVIWARPVWTQVFRGLGTGETNATPVDAEVYDAFAKQIILQTPWSERFPFDVVAVLALFRPKEPSYERALRYWETLSLTNHAAISTFTPSERDIHVKICLRLSRLLLAQGQTESAGFVLQSMSQHFAEELGVKQSEVGQAEPEGQAEPKRVIGSAISPRPSEDELANLEELDKLLVG